MFEFLYCAKIMHFTNVLQKKYYIIGFLEKEKDNPINKKHEKYIDLCLYIVNDYRKFKDIFNYVSKNDKTSMFRVFQFLYYTYKLTHKN